MENKASVHFECSEGNVKLNIFTRKVDYAAAEIQYDDTLQCFVQVGKQKIYLFQ